MLYYSVRYQSLFDMMWCSDRMGMGTDRLLVGPYIVTIGNRKYDGSHIEPWQQQGAGQLAKPRCIFLTFLQSDSDF